LVLVLLAAAALTIVTRDYPDASVILLVVVVNTVLSVRQEVAADQALAALDELTSPTCRVLRDGYEQQVAADQVVPGDLLLLGEGDLVPADGIVVDAVALRLDESALTGESVPVDKLVAADLSGSGAEDPDHLVFAGTAVVHGRGAARVQSTGEDSTLGRVAGMMRAERATTPLQLRMAGLSRLLALAAVLLAGVVLLLGWRQGQSLELMLVAAASLVVAAVPESLPAVVTVSLSLAARRMARRGAVVRRLAAVETLGSVTLLATDKTGTLTEANMTVVDWWQPAGSDVQQLHRAVRLCNDAAVDPETGHEVGADPTEVALLRATRHVQAISQLPRTDEVPFDSATKRMTTWHAHEDGSVLVVCKGAPEVLLDPTVLDEPDEVLGAARERSIALSSSGLRVLAVAQRRLPGGRGAPLTAEDPGLHLLGLVALQDPPKLSAADTLNACRAAGIRLALVTGDHASTATSIARQVRLTQGPARVLDLATRRDALDARSRGDDAVVDHLESVDVIARATPADKLEAIRAWQRAGNVVAMTGDGVNDGPALRTADIGVAMGKRGTEVARQAADLVLGDDELETLVHAVEEGRRVYANIRRFLLYGLSGGIAEILVMLIGPLVGVPLPLLPSQILWINLLTHSVVGTALGSEPVDRWAMNRPPRDPAEGVLGGGLWWRMLALAVVVAACGAATSAIATGPGARSAMLVGLGAPMLGVALGVRADPAAADGRRAWFGANPLLPLSVLFSALLLVGAVTVGPLQHLLTTIQPGWPVLIASALSGGLGYAAARLLRLH
jgi:Ca2+-transporting ATPase